jgi:predicted nucleic acid-binding protein
VSTTFADTSYYLALLNADDELNPAATQLTPQLQGRIVTTAWVLAEVADALCRPGYRDLAVEFIRDLQADPRVTVVPPSQQLFDEGLDLYARRPDKAWSLTDCISFVVMKQHHLTDALTGDHHFAQAGFTVLLR